MSGVLPDELAARAARAGVALGYTSFWGEPQAVPRDVVERILAAMGEPDTAESPPETLVFTHGTAPRIDSAGPWKLYSDDLRGDRPVAQGSEAAELPRDIPVGYYRLRRQGLAETFVIVSPPRCWVPEPLLQGARWWGLSTQFYSLRSADNWGIGDFGDLRALVGVAAGRGAAFVGLSPLHALFPHRPDSASPYSPSSRLALNPLYVDVPGVPEFTRCDEARALVAGAAFQQRLAALREADTVQYAGVAAAKEEVLALLWRHFREQELAMQTRRANAFLRFARERAATLGRHALHEAIQLHLHAADPAVWGWPAWPEAMREPASPEVAEFAREHEDAVQYRLWLQWLAEEQLASVQRDARSRMPLGLYCDLAVGANEGGSETWSQRRLYAMGMHVGAPPDPLNTLGQDWGLPPVNPTALAAARFAPFIALLRANMRHAGALRMDHVMALMRLFWTGAGGGTYVAYPLDALMAVVAVESHRHQCAVIGEDLGNVAPEMRDAMARLALMSYRPLIFERAADGAFRPPADWEPRAVAVVTTHDLPTLRGFWSGADIDVQSRMGFLRGDANHSRMVLDRAQDRARLLLALQHEGLLPGGATVHPPSLADDSPLLAAAVHAYVARTSCWLASAQLEDMTGQLHQVNVPGTTEEMNPNWRMRLPIAVEDLAGDARFAAVAQAMQQERAWQPATGRQEADDAANGTGELPDLDTADIPLGTYRVQFHAGSTFAQVTQAVPYLHALGVSHLYSSPYLKARPGSTHGYDVIDPSVLNPEVGSDDEHTALCDALAARGMGQMLDIVPNHMGVLEADNPWWQDVLEHGEASPHAQTFDIEWSAAAPEMRGRVLLPVLGDHFGRVLEAGELQVRFDAEAGRFSVHYYGHHAPVDPRDYPDILSALPMPVPGVDRDAGDLAQLQSLLDAFAHLPARDTPHAQERAARLRDAPLLRQRLAALAREHAWLREWIAACLRQLCGHAGDAASFDALEALLQRQAFRLADWRVAGDDINYRRFFDINALAAVRMESPAVFEAVHQRVLRWLAEGKITGLRIDHPDGLSEPGEYFERLQRRHAALSRAAGREPRALYVVVEKILADHEPLPADWRVHGGTGYRFSSSVNALFVDAAAEAAFDAAYEAFTGDTAGYDATVYECKKLIIDTALSSDLSWLTETLYRITRADRTACDFTRNRLRTALAEVAAAFPVYRTYVGTAATGAVGSDAHAAAPPLADADRQHIEWAIAQARRRLGTAEAGLLAYLRDVMTGEPAAAARPAGEGDTLLRRAFVRRWQQFTAPVMAKAMEDTAFYRYVRLVSLNDVGSEPRRFGITAAAFHHAGAQRAQHRPHWLLATSTHDSKRSEDVRARLNVLSEMPATWEDAVLRWSDMGEGFKAEVDGAPAPQPGDEWALYQALVGIWPAAPTTPPERKALADRVQQYMLKAVREAKRETNWMAPNEPYEKALAGFIDRLLALEAFVQDLQRFVRQVAPFGFRNSLSQLALKLTVPGVPDIYQGCEQWNFSLVDPDNRRPVDFASMAADLAQVQLLYREGFPPASAWPALLPELPPGRTKQLVTWRLLALRTAEPSLFRHGSYLPLALEGPAAGHAVAFARVRGGKAVVVIAARLLHRLGARGWQGTRVVLAGVHPSLEKDGAFQDWMTGAAYRCGPGSTGLDLGECLAGAGPNGGGLPFAVLVTGTDDAGDENEGKEERAP